MFSYLYINAIFIEFIYQNIIYTFILVRNVDFKINDLFYKLNKCKKIQF